MAPLSSQLSYCSSWGVPYTVCVCKYVKLKNWWHLKLRRVWLSRDIYMRICESRMYIYIYIEWERDRFIYIYIYLFILYIYGCICTKRNTDGQTDRSMDRCNVVILEKTECGQNKKKWRWDSHIPSISGWL